MTHIHDFTGIRRIGSFTMQINGQPRKRFNPVRVCACGLSEPMARFLAPTNLRCGDIVFHSPTGEQWTVAYADYEIGYMAAAGWPSERAMISDCMLVKRATDAQHREEVEAWRNCKGDSRAGIVLRMYGNAAAVMNAREDI